MEIKGFLETSFIDWPDKICAVLFLPICNFRCPYCHNHGLILRPEEYETLSWPFIRERFQTLRGWLDGVCVSGGEPTLHPDLPDLLAAIKALGFPVKLDTNGTRPKVLHFLVDEKLVDFVAMDVKAPAGSRTLQSLCRGPGHSRGYSGIHRPAAFRKGALPVSNHRGPGHAYPGNTGPHGPGTKRRD